MLPARLIYRLHAIRRMFERRISVEDVEQVIATGEVIEEYPEDQPYPSNLILGFVQERPLHVVAAENAPAGETIIITVYEPDPDRWDASFRRRLSP
jgi:hypothetical protein